MNRKLVSSGDSHEKAPSGPGSDEFPVARVGNGNATELNGTTSELTTRNYLAYVFCLYCEYLAARVVSMRKVGRKSTEYFINFSVSTNIPFCFSDI